MRILLTGVTGFIGKVLIQELLRQNFSVSVIVRNRSNQLPDIVTQFILGDFGSNPDFSSSLVNIDCVIHLAGRAHIIDNNEASALKSFRQINTNTTLGLAKQAVAAKVKRFIYLSSIRVNGNQTEVPFLETDTPNPQESYALSKYEAEQGLLKLSEHSFLEVVIVRPPLVYGRNAPGNFGKLVRWVESKNNVPLPLGAVHNIRSVIAIDNLVSFISTCIKNPKAANEIFLISDDEDLSTTQILRSIAKAFNKRIILIPIPLSWMRFLAKIVGKDADAVRLFSSLIIDSSKARDLLDWSPVTTMQKQLDSLINNEKNN